jgi:asparagine synthase (glutamine-hydrolysing)
MLQILRADLLRANDTVDLWYEFPVRAVASEGGVRIILSGWGGDQFISHYGTYRHAETFLRGRVLSTLRDMVEESTLANNRARRFLGMCYRNILLPVLPAALNYRRQEAQALRHDFLDCVSADFRTWAEGQQREIELPLGNNVRADQLSFIGHNYINSRTDSWAVSGMRAGIEYSYPLLDKRVVEFALGLPPELFRSRGIDRYAYRSAVARWLPEEISQANMKVELCRVSELYEVSRIAVREWRDLCASEMNPYVSMKKLSKEIDALPAFGDRLQEAEVLKLLVVSKSILVAML